MKISSMAAWIVLAGVAVLVGCEALPGPLKPKPVKYQEVGVILMEDRIIPAEIYLTENQPARLHVIGGPGGSNKVGIKALGFETGVTPGSETIILIEESQLGTVKGQELTGEAGRGSAKFIVTSKGPEMAPTPVGGKLEVAVVMTEEMAAPSQVVLLRGVPTILYVAKTDSDAGADNFKCDVLGMTIAVNDREVKRTEWTPVRAGTFEFLGTVTPDSHVKMVVVEPPTSTR